MNTSTPELQKLENLLKSATNARQRKMYKSLLEKARQDQDSQNQESTRKSKSPNSAKSKVDKIVEASTITTTKQKQEKQKSKEVLAEATAKETVVDRKTLTAEVGESVTEAKSEKANIEPKEITPEKIQQPKSQKTCQETKPTIFQAVGLLKCSPVIKENKLYINVDGQEYELRRGKLGSRRHYDQLKLNIEQNGSSECWLRVYPKIVHDLKNQKIQYWFTLVKAFSQKSQVQSQQENFVFRGVWHYVPHCKKPVISIYRNIDMLQWYKKTSPTGKKTFAKPQDFPVIWSAPVEPSRYQPQLEVEKQMPKYFVQVKAVFKNGRFEVVEMLCEPTLDIPQYIKPVAKK